MTVGIPGLREDLCESGAGEEGEGIGRAGHEVFVKNFCGGGVAFAEDLLAEIEAGCFVEDTFFLEAGEGICVKNLRPFV